MKLTHAPIKRSQELAPFSREHHDALLFVWKIRQGIKHQINLSVMASYCRWFWENDLKEHFEKEEAAFSTVLRNDHPMMEKMLDDHDAIQAKIEELSQFPSATGFERLAQIMQYHVRYEERELFKYIEQIASPQQLHRIFESIKEAKQSAAACTWDNEFWLTK